MDTELCENKENDSDSVFAAADALAAAGHDVSLTMMEGQLAHMDRASLLPILQEWRFRRAVIQSPAGEVWRAVVGTFFALKGDIEGVTARMNSQIENKQMEWVKDAEQEQEKREQTQLNLEKEFMESQKRLVNMLSYMSELEALLDQAMPMLESLEEHHKEQADLKRQLQEALAERDQGTAQISEARKHTESVQTEHTKLLTEFETATRNLKDEQEERNKLRIEHDALRKQIEAMQIDLNRYRELEEQARIEAEEEAQRLGREGDWLLAAEDWPELPRQLAVATARMAALRAERDSLRERIGDLKEQLNQSNELLSIRLGGGSSLANGYVNPKNSAPRIELLKGGRI